MKSVVSSDSVPLPIDTVPQQSFFQGEFQKGHGYLKNCNIEREISKRTRISEKTETKQGNLKKNTWIYLMQKKENLREYTGAEKLQQKQGK